MEQIYTALHTVLNQIWRDFLKRLVDRFVLVELYVVGACVEPLLLVGELHS